MGQRILLASSQGGIDLSQVVSVSLSIAQPNVAQSILAGALRRAGRHRRNQGVYGAIVDGYGQSTRAKWPERVANDEQLKAAAQKNSSNSKAGWPGVPIRTSTAAG